MGYIFLMIACLAGISKGVAMKSSGRVCPGEYNSVRINAVRSLICASVSVAIFLISGASYEGEYWWIWLISGLSNALMMFVWILCAQRMSLIFVEAFGLIGSTVIPMLLAPVLYEGDTVALPQWLGAASLFVAIVLLSLSPANKRARDGGGDGSVSESSAEEAKGGGASTAVYIILYVLSNAAMCITQKLYPSRAGSEYTVFFNLMTFLVVFAVFTVVLGAGRAVAGKGILPENSGSVKKLLCYVTVAAVMIYVYQYFSTLSASMLPSAIFYPLARGISMLLTAVCDVLIFRQKLTVNTCIGLLFIIATVVLTNL